MTSKPPDDIIASEAYVDDARNARALFESMETRQLLLLQAAFESSLRIVEDPRLVVFAAGRLALIALVIQARSPAPAPIDLFAWIGEDELGSGVVGLKQELRLVVPVPLVCIASHRNRLLDDAMIASLQAQADHYGKAIRFARFTIVEDLLVLQRRQ